MEWESKFASFMCSAFWVLFDVMCHCGIIVFAAAEDETVYRTIFIILFILYTFQVCHKIRILLVACFFVVFSTRHKHAEHTHFAVHY